MASFRSRIKRTASSSSYASTIASLNREDLDMLKKSCDILNDRINVMRKEVRLVKSMIVRGDEDKVSDIDTIEPDGCSERSMNMSIAQLAIDEVDVHVHEDHNESNTQLLSPLSAISTDSDIIIPTFQSTRGILQDEESQDKDNEVELLSTRSFPPLTPSKLPSQAAAIQGCKQQITDAMAQIHRLDSEMHVLKTQMLEDDRVGREKKGIMKGSNVALHSSMSNAGVTHLRTKVGASFDEVASEDHTPEQEDAESKVVDSTTSDAPNEKRIDLSGGKNEDEGSKGDQPFIPSNERETTPQTSLSLRLQDEVSSNDQRISRTGNPTQSNIHQENLKCLGRCLLRLPWRIWEKVESYSRPIETSSPLRNTETIVMYTIATLCQQVRAADQVPGEEHPLQEEGSLFRKRIKSLLAALFSLTLVVFQICILMYVGAESTVPTCGSHTDCTVGSFCVGTANDNYWQPRCNQCQDKLDEYYPDRQCDSEQFESFDDIDYTVVWFDRSYKTTFGTDYNYTEYNFEDEFSFLACLAETHCDDTSLPSDNEGESIIPDDMILITSQISNDQIIVLIGTAILFAGIVSQDVSEAMIEDVTLNVFINNEASESVKSAWFVITSMIIRLSIRLRQLILPIAVGHATVSVLLTDYLSAKNVLLNFLAVAFLLDADNTLVAHLVLPRKEQELVERELYDTWESGNASPFITPITFFWPQFFGISIALFIVLLVLKMEVAMEWTRTLIIEEGGTEAMFILSNIFGAPMLVLWAFFQKLARERKRFHFRLELCRCISTYSFVWLIMYATIYSVSRTYFAWWIPFITVPVCLVFLYLAEFDMKRRYGVQ